jgi:hypothetical protein
VEGADCRTAAGSVVLIVGCYMACSDWKMLSFGEEQEQ